MCHSEHVFTPPLCRAPASDGCTANCHKLCFQRAVREAPLIASPSVDATRSVHPHSSACGRGGPPATFPIRVRECCDLIAVALVSVLQHNSEQTRYLESLRNFFTCSTPTVGSVHAKSLAPAANTLLSASDLSFSSSSHARPFSTGVLLSSYGLFFFCF